MGKGEKFVKLIGGTKTVEETQILVALFLEHNEAVGVCMHRVLECVNESVHGLNAIEHLVWARLVDSPLEVAMDIATTLLQCKNEAIAATLANALVVGSGAHK